ncbi:hypothetical protein EDD22DRAFT_1049079 [Suillus occidentalis]|nr:hypothetical protein EDD22DRAFT_1049079 [Suillus occidentalis]
MDIQELRKQQEPRFSRWSWIYLIQIRLGLQYIKKTDHLLLTAFSVETAWALLAKQKSAVNPLTTALTYQLKSNSAQKTQPALGMVELDLNASGASQAMFCGGGSLPRARTVQRVDWFRKIDQVLISPSIFECTASRHNSWGLASPIGLEPRLMQYPALGLEGYRWAPIRIGYDAQRSTRTEVMITPMHGDWVNYDTHLSSTVNETLARLWMYDLEACKRAHYQVLVVVRYLLVLLSLVANSTSNTISMCVTISTATTSSIKSYCLRSGLDLVKIQTEDNAHPAADYYLPIHTVCMTKSYAFAFGVHLQ